jgi:hypothetical protein
MISLLELNKPKIVNISRRGVYFEALLSDLPDQGDLRKRVYELQEAAGYSPLGYDGPFGIQVDVKPEGYLVTWNCAGSCD